jgi:tight adherence protein B
MLFKKKVEHEPQFYLSCTNMQVPNYRVYYLGKPQKLLAFFAGFAIGAVVGYLFFGGIGADEFGTPTLLTYILNSLASLIGGAIAGYAAIPLVTELIFNRRKKQLSTQFRDMLEALSTSLSAGKNVTDAFRAVLEDMRIQYESDAFIIIELEALLSGIDSNVNIEDLLVDFGERSGNDDIKSFANVFEICYRKGGNINDTVRNTHGILSGKMEIADDIETTVASNKMEQNIMIVIPIALIGIIKFMSPDFAKNFASPAGIISSVIAIVLFVIAYLVGKRVLNIKI